MDRSTDTREKLTLPKTCAALTLVEQAARRRRRARLMGVRTEVMPSAMRSLIAAVLAAIAVIGATTRSLASRGDVWFAPDPESPDLLDLFRHPEEWRHARSHIKIIKLSPLQFQPKSQLKRNTYEELSAIGAFAAVRSWGMALASEEGALKPWDCTGVKAAERTIDRALSAHSAGGRIDYMAMDEPMAGGMMYCHLDLDASAERTASYANAVLDNENLKEAGLTPEIGDIEAYPWASADQVMKWTAALMRDGFIPAFFHLDVNVSFVDVHPEVAFARDIKTLESFFKQKKIPFGVVVWGGYDPLNSDQDYHDHAIAYAERLRNLIDPEDQIIIQSWVIRSSLSCKGPPAACLVEKSPCTNGDPGYCGSHSIPVNLPETARYTHTRLVDDVLTLLQR
jgi:hypothetical protein